MKIYHTETIEDYDALMIELEEQGCTWAYGHKPTTSNDWRFQEEHTCIKLKGQAINRGDLELFNNLHPDVPIIKYKSREEVK